MTIRIDDLTPLQVRTMIKLDDDRERDSVGRMVSELTDGQLITCFKLAQLRLVTADPGWRGTVWFRLTPAGRHLKENGTA